MFACDKENNLSDKQLRVAFDGDAVLFSDESEIVAQEQGLEKYFDHEKKNEEKALGEVGQLHSQLLLKINWWFGFSAYERVNMFMY